MSPDDAATSGERVNVKFSRGQQRMTTVLLLCTGMSVQKAVETCCQRFEVVEDWNYGFFCVKANRWLIDWTSLDAYSSLTLSSLMLRVKTPEYHDQEAAALKNPCLKPVINQPVLTVHHLSMANERGSGGASHGGLFSSISGLFGRSDKRHLETKIRGRRLYLSALLFSGDGRVLITRDNILPTVCVNSRNDALGRDLESTSEEFHWLLRDALDCERSMGSDKKTVSPPAETKRRKSTVKRNAKGIYPSGKNRRALTVNDLTVDNDASSYSASSTTESVNGSVDSDYGRQRDAESIVHREFSSAMDDLCRILHLPTLGVLHERPVSVCHGDAHMLVMLQHIPTNRLEYVAPDLVKSGTLRWQERDQLDRDVYEWKEDLWWRYQCSFNGRMSRLAGGLYIAVFYAENTVRGLNVLLPRRRRSFLPICKIRDDPVLKKDEESWLKHIADGTCILPIDEHHQEIETVEHSASIKSRFSTVSMAEGEGNDNESNESLSGVDFHTVFSNAYHQLQRAVRIDWSASDLYMKHCITLNASGEMNFDSDFNQPVTSRIILVVRPMRQVQSRQKDRYDATDFMMFPLTLFEMLNQSAYNTKEAGRIRDRTQTIMEKISERKNTFQQKRNSLHPSVAAHGYESDSVMDDELGVSINEPTIAQLEYELMTMRRQHSASLWTRRVISWDRDRTFRNAGLSIPNTPICAGTSNCTDTSDYMDTSTTSLDTKMESPPQPVLQVTVTVVDSVDQ